MIVWLASYPRSGNTFIRVLINSILHHPTYSGFNSGDDISYDLRKAKRHFVGIPFSASVDGQELVGELFDLSRNGAGLVVNQGRLVRKDEVLSLSFSLDETAIAVDVIVRWQRTGSQDTEAYQCGVEFQACPEAVQAAIDKYAAFLERTNPTGHRRLPEDLHRALLRNARPEDISAVLNRMEEEDEVYFIKTHSPIQRLYNNKHRAILIVRDGRDTIVSLAWYTMNVDRTLKRFFRGLPFVYKNLWRPGVFISQLSTFLLALLIASSKAFGFKKWMHEVILKIFYAGSKAWGAFANGWLDREGAKTVLVKFEDLIAAPVPNLARALQELDLAMPIEGADIPSFEALQQLHPQFFRSGKVANWKKELPPELTRIFVERNRQAMERFGYIVE